MKPEDINQSLHQLGYSQTLIAEVMGKSPSLISKVISGNAKSFGVAYFIATILEKSVNEVFPNIKQKLNRQSPTYIRNRNKLQSIYSECKVENI
ncbi:helix-turn-helix domain-containing protein [Pseudidiomarina marina]|uniref:HTH cro/C1-type domain-containing protein n=1 Tax=Pseudidiomarina marina TaxID=502366 RepID=A0A432YCS7_9GAMM|nr:hypothetical protein CWI76_11115 [Pseudidiomarina marina]